MEKIARTTLYHVARPENRDSILATGLNYEGVTREYPGWYEDDNPWGDSGQPRGVYLWDDYKSAVSMWSRGEGDIWEVDATNLHLAEDGYFKWPAWYTRDPIPPDRIKLVRKQGEGQYDWDPYPSQRQTFEDWINSTLEKYDNGYEEIPFEDPRTSNILDPIHPKLDQRVFDGEDPKPHIIKFIKRIYYKAFSNRFHVPVEDVPLYVNLIMTGSLTTYQYSYSSDCDVSAFFDWNKMYQDLDLPPDEARRALIALSIDHIDGTFLPGGIHPVQFFVVKQGLAPTDLYKPSLRSGYDMDAQVWIVPPEKDRAHDIATDFPDIYQRAADIADKMSEMLDAGDEDRAKELWKMVHKKRQLDQTQGLGDFCEGNIVYKWLVHQGLVNRLRSELGLQIASHVDKQAVEWSGDLDPRSLDNMELPEQWERLRGQVQSLAQSLNVSIEWLPPTEWLQSTIFTSYDARLEDGSFDWKNPKVWHEAKIPNFRSELGYFVALHELGHAAFKNEHPGSVFEANSMEQEYWAWHWGLEHAQIPLSQKTLATTRTYVDTYEHPSVPQQSQSAPGWIRSSFEPPQDVLDTFKQIAQCPQCGHHMLREEGQELYCPDCGYTFKTAGKRMKVMYDHERDRIILSSESSISNKIIGEYDGEGSVTLYEAEKQWINPTYFRRLWNYSYPHRPLSEVHYESGEDRKKLKTQDHPHHERERSVD